MNFDDNSCSNGGTDEILTFTNDARFCIHIVYECLQFAYNYSHNNLCNIDYSGSLIGLKEEESDMIYDMYKKHSQIVGFSIRRKATCLRVNGVGTPKIERYFVCSCEGEHENGVHTTSTTQVRNRSITRCHCKASVKLRVNSKGLREVRRHITEHNHPLTPPQWQHHHRSERKITEAEGEVIKAMIEAQVAPSVQFRVAAVAPGGEVFFGHTKRDHIKFVTRLKTLFIEGGDATTLINMLTNYICHLFWRDSMMKEDYMMYHDVVIFDTTYRTNRHRLCQWHIQHNAISHFGSLKHDRTFQNIFNKCLNGCYSETEFEGMWLKMIKFYGLDDSAWFKRLYNIKTKWCTALNNKFFSAGILSSQRSESTNHAMGFQASKTTSLTESTPTSVYPLVDLLQHASQEFSLVMGTRAAILPSEDSVLVYRVDSPCAEGSSHHVTFDCDNNLIECTCKKFLVMGMLCSHIICVLHIHSVTEIPSTYILRRWSKFSKADIWNRLLPNDMRRSAANDAINWRRSMLTNLNNLVTKCQNMVTARAIIEKICATANDEVQTLFRNLHIDDDQARDEVRGKKGMSVRRRCTENRAENGASYIVVPRLI
ncbi:hypothetical protein RND81_01G163700 [Saponaria officinalis]|uniref:SWIM-type domain-containing protein n=1 Tax=Saponaria officinalis TaxID=3572 RepID=A0AAW1NGF1_SAPOF